MDNPNEPRQVRRDTPAVFDSLEAQRQRFRSHHQSSNGSNRYAMQQLYKQQLDSIIEEKLRQKGAERTKNQLQRQQFNQQVEEGKQAQKQKQISYKNYYNMLMSNQMQKQQSYVNPFAQRDHLKQALISKGIDQQRQKYMVQQHDIRSKQAQRRNNYRNELLMQIDQRRQREQALKEESNREKQAFQKNSKGPGELQRYQREQHQQEINKYRQDLDMLGRGGMGRGGVEVRQSGLIRNRSEHHNTLTNPMPYNIQNPYILKQMGRNQSYLAMKGSQNLNMS